jgi:hypothetical protein
VKLSIVVQPPGSWPSKDDELNTSSAHPLKFLEGGLIIWRCAPILPISLKERKGMALRKASWFPQILID